MKQEVSKQIKFAPASTLMPDIAYPASGYHWELSKSSKYDDYLGKDRNYYHLSLVPDEEGWVESVSVVENNFDREWIKWASRVLVEQHWLNNLKRACEDGPIQLSKWS